MNSLFQRRQYKAPRTHRGERGAGPKAFSVLSNNKKILLPILFFATVVSCTTYYFRSNYKDAIHLIHSKDYLSKKPFLKAHMGNVTAIKNGDIQVMSAGTGIRHSEYNKNGDKEVKFLQIWVFPNKRDVTPRYDQITLKAEDRHNRFQQILSPDPGDEGVWIHQDAWFHLGQFDTGKRTSYQLKKKGNGVYVFLISGHAEVNGQKLDTRDGLGIWDIESLEFTAMSNAEILVMEVPMHV